NPDSLESLYAATGFGSTASPEGLSDGASSAMASAASRRLISRADSIGVSVNDTSNDTAIANDAVNPNDDMKRPTMPPMKPTGKKTASSDSVVAITARPISRVPSIAA